MIQVLLFFWIAGAFFIVREQRIIRIIIYLTIFSLLSSACFLLFAAPDVAMAEAVMTAFSTIIFIITFEKYYSYADLSAKPKKAGIAKHLLPLVFVLALFFLFAFSMPGGIHADGTAANGNAAGIHAADTILKNRYISMFRQDVGGENAVTAIYLGYRMYDTLFEALMLLVSVVAVVHLSMYSDNLVLDGKRNDANRSPIAAVTIRIISPVLVLFGVYLILNGHISPGGGFQGGVVLASFFVCRYMIHAIYDIRINRVIMFEKLVYLGIILLAFFFVFCGVRFLLPMGKTAYLVVMNLLIGLKVACGFLIIFYRFVAFEWK